jgi:hypothetical protein
MVRSMSRLIRLRHPLMPTRLAGDDILGRSHLPSFGECLS